MRARRDAALLRIDHAQFEEILRSSTSVSHALLGTLAGWLTNNSRSQPARPRPPATIAVVSLDPGPPDGSSPSSKRSFESSRASSGFPDRQRRIQEPSSATRWPSYWIASSTAMTTCC